MADSLSPPACPDAQGTTSACVPTLKDLQAKKGEEMEDVVPGSPTATVIGSHRWEGATEAGGALTRAPAEHRRPGPLGAVADLTKSTMRSPPGCRTCPFKLNILPHFKASYFPFFKSQSEVWNGLLQDTFWSPGALPGFLPWLRRTSPLNVSENTVPCNLGCSPPCHLHDWTPPLRPPSPTNHGVSSSVVGLILKFPKEEPVMPGGSPWTS